MKPVRVYAYIAVAGVLVASLLVRAVLEALPTAPVAPAPVLFGGPSEERDSIVAFEARRAGMPDGVAVAISHVENWSGDSTVRHSRSGATGLMQVMHFWADSFHVECGTDSLIVRRRNACVGVRIAKLYFEQCGDWDCALRRYVGAACTKRDTPLNCERKKRVGTDYVLAVMQKMYRTDLSPARDEMAFGRWRQDTALKTP